MKKLARGTDPLLTRDDFRNGVFARDGHKCVICKAPGQDAHHILERRLFDDGGYYLSNGATLCGNCHIKAEETTLSVENIREACNILAPRIPEHFYPDSQYDKWGNIVLANGMRTKGELFHDESVQKILSQGDVLNQFLNYTKYPRTLHFPWSPGITSDDKVHKDFSGFEGKTVVVTKKMDGENTTFYPDYMHARSLDAESHPSQSWVRKFHAGLRHDIPAGWRICGENLYAKHSIAYNDLPTYFMPFSIWDGRNTCLSWDEFLFWCGLLDLTPVPVLYIGVWSIDAIRECEKKLDPARDEGYVVRIAPAFHFTEFRKVVGKYVRAGHIQTSQNWRLQPVIPNKLSNAQNAST